MLFDSMNALPPHSCACGTLRYAVNTRVGAARITQKLLSILLNLSVERQCQVDIGVFGLDLLLSILNDRSLPSACSDLVSRVLINAGRHPVNRSKLCVDLAHAHASMLVSDRVTELLVVYAAAMLPTSSGLLNRCWMQRPKRWTSKMRQRRCWMRSC